MEEQGQKLIKMGVRLDEGVEVFAVKFLSLWENELIGQSSQPHFGHPKAWWRSLNGSSRALPDRLRLCAMLRLR